MGLGAAIVLSLAAPGTSLADEPLASRLTPCVVLAAPEPRVAPPRSETPPAESGRAWRHWALAEAVAAGVAAIGYADGGSRVQAGIDGVAALLVTRDLFEGTPPTPTRGHVVTIAGLVALAAANLALEHDGAPRGTRVAVNFAALNAIAIAARAGAR